MELVFSVMICVYVEGNGGGVGGKGVCVRVCGGRWKGAADGV